MRGSRVKRELLVHNILRAQIAKASADLGQLRVENKTARETDRYGDVEHYAQGTRAEAQEEK